MRTSELKKLLADNIDSKVSIYSNYYNYKSVTVDSVSDEMVKVSYGDEENNWKQLYIQLDSITAVEKI